MLVSTLSMIIFERNAIKVFKFIFKKGSEKIVLAPSFFGANGLNDKPALHFFTMQDTTSYEGELFEEKIIHGVSIKEIFMYATRNPDPNDYFDSLMKQLILYELFKVFQLFTLSGCTKICQNTFLHILLPIARKYINSKLNVGTLKGRFDTLKKKRILHQKQFLIILIVW